MRYPINKGIPKVPVLILLAAVSLAGCSNNKTTLVVPPPSAAVGLPTPPAAGPVNTYSGAQSPGAWTVTLDNTKGSFSFQPVTYPAAPTSGTIQQTSQQLNGFTKLSSGGYAVEVKGRAVILRPGDATTPPVFAVPQTECYPITGRLLFQYIAMQFPLTKNNFGSSGPKLGYGSVVADTDSTGKSWQFESLQGNTISGPGSFSATCGSSNGQDAISFTGQQSLLNDIWDDTGNPVLVPTAKTQSNVWIGPSGFFVADQSDPTGTDPTGASVAGMAEPASALSTSDVVAQKYSGLIYEPATRSASIGSAPAPVDTSPVAFGQVVSSGTSSATTLTGGIFPNDDVTQTPNSDITINLGKQSATINGLYSSASITLSDPAQNCANYTGPGKNTTSGINPQGYPTCTFAAVAIAGSLEGKYALFITAFDWATRFGGAPMQMYLFEQ